MSILPNHAQKTFQAIGNNTEADALVAASAPAGIASGINQHTTYVFILSTLFIILFFFSYSFF